MGSSPPRHVVRNSEIACARNWQVLRLQASGTSLQRLAVVKIETTGLEGSKVLDDANRRAIDRDNALALFPRFASKAAKAA